MRFAVPLFAIVLIFSVNMKAGEARKEDPVTVAYFYKVKWGHQEEFLELYKKNHYPVMEAMVKSGRLLEVKTFVPSFHGDGRSDWTFMSVLIFKSWDVMNDESEGKRIVKELYPDRERFEREERRRFELLEAHWDVPLRKAPMKP